MRKILSFLFPIILFLASCNPNECKQVNCLNGGACNEGVCICPEGYTGQYCEETDDGCGNACTNGQVCVNGNCECPQGYEGPNCETLTDPCDTVTCTVANSTCVNGVCECDTGFEGPNCQPIVDPCATVTCPPGRVCDDGDCVCDVGLVGPNCLPPNDPCAWVTCGTNSSCVNGTCECDEGYEGVDCATVSRDRFLGSYLVDQTCDVGSDNYSMTVTTGGPINEIEFSDLGGQGIGAIGVVDGSDVTVMSSANIGGTPYTLNGSGSISGNILTIDFTVVFGTSTITCTAICTLQ